MKKELSSLISIFLSVDAHPVFNYYSSHDPAPFSCVILSKPGERLIFSQDPFKKEILVLKKIGNGRTHCT